jgi:hypothetical protein
MVLFVHPRVACDLPCLAVGCMDLLCFRTAGHLLYIQTSTAVQVPKLRYEVHLRLCVDSVFLVLQLSVDGGKLLCIVLAS